MQEQHHNACHHKLAVMAIWHTRVLTSADPDHSMQGAFDTRTSHVDTHAGHLLCQTVPNPNTVSRASHTACGLLS